MFRSYPLSARFLVFIVLPVAALLVAVFLYFRPSQAQAVGQVLVRGVRAPVTLARDDHDVLYIKADNERDVYFAMGYAHAQDRLWQLEMQRRMAQGRLSELFGQKTIKQDIWFRTLDLQGAAASALPALGAPARDSLEAYAAGVNAWIDSGTPLPPEFVLMELKPAHWRPVDSLAVIKLLALSLGGNLRQETERFVAGQVLDPAQLRSLNTGYPDDAPVTVQGLQQSKAAGQVLAGLGLLQAQVEDLLQLGGRFVGSNAWVVSARLSANGKAILANDPHLSLQLPSMWYAVRQDGGALRASGMSLVGLPAVVFGKNERIAWGGTNMMADVQDLYLEQVDSADPTRYRVGEGWGKISSRIEQIQVKAEFPSSLRAPLEPVSIKIRATAHGPLISDAVGSFEQPVALRWTALDSGDTTYEALFRLSYATDWTGFRQALAFQSSPVLNMLFIDRANNIGYQGAGHIPVRAEGNGTLPVPGWTGTYRWKSYIPYEAMPQSFNPKRGFIVSANNRVSGPEYPYFISSDWAPPARARRIEQMIEQGSKGAARLSMATMQDMQLDLLNLEAQQILPLLTALPPANERQRRALQYLAHWDGQMTRESRAASIYTAWIGHLRVRLFARGLQGYWNKAQHHPHLVSLAQNAPLSAVIDALTLTTIDWCDRAHNGGSCNGALGASLDDGLNELEKLRGANMDDWQWGGMHTIHFRHIPFSDVNLLETVFARKMASGGAQATVNTANANFQGSLGYVQNFGAAFRQVIQFEPGQHLFINSTGQSGHPLSIHYDDMMRLYGEGRYVRFDDNNTVARRALVLVPAPH
ncbi:penicillin acylase family protein [Massilia pseudoviolaceinigra]|uniref:penicillin acylase family protein n=1 Tax=Massilia pseudoviolaceinigra TaxID=3057165 RepID=UPI0027965225|nr:penicillin acylase family protein [Massilia sp. CCM 9206]MDQ1919130.1 penicillin acylase family protein [Massilia sp. CCM 9206]